MTDRRSTVTVLLAGAVNLGMAVAKLVGGLLSGSAAMLSEAAHSLADTLNEGFLLTALSRSDRPADEQHPFGYSMERYFWSLLAAISVFVLGAGFSLYQGISALVAPQPRGSLTLSFVVLAVAIALEGASLLRGVWQVRHEAPDPDSSTAEELRRAEPTVRAVVFEDGAAVLGVGLAGGGLLLDEAFGTQVYDAIASLLIGVLLIVVAGVLGRHNKELLIGRAVDEETLQEIRREIEAHPGIDGVISLLTMRLGPDEVLLAARVDVVTGVDGDEIERIADQVDAALQQANPEVKHVFLDPTPGGGGRAGL